MNIACSPIYGFQGPSGVLATRCREASVHVFWAYTSKLIVRDADITRNGNKWLMRKLYRFARFARRNCGYCQGHEKPLEVILAEEWAASAAREGR